MSHFGNVCQLLFLRKLADGFCWNKSSCSVELNKSCISWKTFVLELIIYLHFVLFSFKALSVASIKSIIFSASGQTLYDRAEKISSINDLLKDTKLNWLTFLLKVHWYWFENLPKSSSWNENNMLKIKTDENTFYFLR